MYLFLAYLAALYTLAAYLLTIAGAVAAPEGGAAAVAGAGLALVCGLEHVAERRRR